MTIKEAISQLNWLREDRESLCNGDPDDDEIWNADIEAIDVALKQMQENAELKRQIEKLAAYEDTGLTPDEIKHVKHTNAIRKELLEKALKSIDYLDKELSKRLEHEKDMLRLDMVMKSIALEIDESEDSF